jgi:hypothetical protein
MSPPPRTVPPAGWERPTWPCEIRCSRSPNQGSRNARSVQLRASLREDDLPVVGSAVFPQGAAYGRQGLDRQGDESGI